MEYLGMACLIGLLVIAGKYRFLNKQIQSINRQLREPENRLITIEFGNKEVEELARGINTLIEEKEKIMLKEQKNTFALKEMIANISHDMRTPLTCVQGYLQLAKKNCTQREIKEYLSIAEERAGYCNTLIRDFFEISLLEMGQSKPNMERIDVAGVLCETILAYYPSFSEKNIKPHFEKGDTPVFAYGDKEMVNRVFANLLSNGIKYASGDIYFYIESGKDVVLVMENSFEEDSLEVERLFEKFYKKDRLSNAKGSGLGLTICKQLMEFMEGNIHAESQEGKLRFILSFRNHEATTEKMNISK